MKRELTFESVFCCQIIIQIKYDNSFTQIKKKKTANGSVSKVRGQAVSSSLSLFYSAGSSYLYRGEIVGAGGGSLGCRLGFAQRTFPSLVLAVIFLATWRLEAAALIETHPSPPTSSSGFFLPVFQNSLFK